MDLGFLDMFTVHWCVLPALILIYILSYLVALILSLRCCGLKRFGPERFVPSEAKGKIISSINFFVFLMACVACEQRGETS